VSKPVNVRCPTDGISLDRPGTGAVRTRISSLGSGYEPSGMAARLRVIGISRRREFRRTVDFVASKGPEDIARRFLLEGNFMLPNVR
jgi:hypothetical protein